MVVFGMRNGPGHLCQNGAQIQVASCDRGAKSLAATLAIPRADASPGCEMLGGGKDAHIDSNLGND